MSTRKPYPSDVTDEEWAFVAPYLALVREDAPQRRHGLRAIFDGLHFLAFACLLLHRLVSLLAAGP
jgi:transposase